MSKPWLEIDLKGFAQILADKGIERIALEPISNALDTDAEEITVSFAQHQGWADLDVEDDDPNGFADLRDAYTLFAPSKRRDDPTKRGRFGMGEKELIAVCAGGGSVAVASTTGTIRWTAEGRAETKERRQAGTSLTARFRMNQDQARGFDRTVRSLLIPDGVKVVYNGEVLQPRRAVATVDASLPTKIVDAEGNLADATRKTTVDFYEPAAAEKAHIYELGVPVVEHDGRWHIDVGQKVPLDRDRNNVRPAYLRLLRQLMLDNTHQMLNATDLHKGWVKDALPKATPDAVRHVIEEIHGKDAVIYDPSNREANKIAVDEGRQVVHGSSFSKEAWAVIKEHELLKPAGQVIQTGVPTSMFGQPPIGEDDYSHDMHLVANYTRAAGMHLLGFEPEVEFANTDITVHQGHAAAWWGGRQVTFNLRYLGKSWPSTVSQQALDELLIHEFAHHTQKDHLSEGFYAECCRLGAKFRSFTGSLR